MDLVLPSAGATAEPIVYAHGGGFICASSELLTHSLTPLVRAGAPVYSIDYPLAPEHPFPAAVVSILRTIAWVKRRTGCASLTLLGDSAGGR